MKAYPYQEIGINFLKERKNACLWDEPGLGKSFQSLSAAKLLNIKNAIIICPASVRMVWKTECSKVGLSSQEITKPSHIGSGFNVISYEGASKFKDYFNTGRFAFDDHKWDLLILDEAHYIKGYNTRKVKRGNMTISLPPKRVEAIYGRNCDGKDSIAETCKHIWTLTGTPVPNNPSELYPTLKCLFPDALEKRNGELMTYWDFVNKYCQTKNNGFGIQIIGGKNYNDLRDRIRGRALRRKKEEVLKDLPSIRYEMLPVNGKLDKISPEESELVTECLNKDEPLDYLKKIGTHVASLRKITALAKVDAVIKWVRESSFKKVVLFAHHKAVIEKLKELENSVYVDGSCSQSHREKAVKDFQHGDAEVFIGQIQAAGTGLTLTAANVLLFVEVSWTPAENRQAADRIHRIGQKNSCLVYFTMIPNSIDENIIRVVKRKTETIRSLGL